MKVVSGSVIVKKKTEKNAEVEVSSSWAQVLGKHTHVHTWIDTGLNTQPYTRKKWKNFAQNVET